MSETTAIAVSNFKGIEKLSKLQSILEENTGGQGINLFAVNRVKMPTGGATIWQMPDEDGAPAKTIDGIIVYQHFVRAYWEGDSPTAGTPPQCSSPDGVTGYGDPGGECHACPLSKFGSRAGGKRGQACKLGRRLYILQPDGLFPLILSLPPMSLGNASTFFLRLAEKELVYRHVVVSISLEKAQNAGGQPYARAVIRKVRVLDESERPRVDAYSAFIQKVADEEAARTMDRGDFDEAA